MVEAEGYRGHISGLARYKLTDGVAFNRATLCCMGFGAMVTLVAVGLWICDRLADWQ